MPAYQRSPFSGTDLCNAAGFGLPPGARRPTFDQDRWDFQDVVGRSIQTTDCQMVLDFDCIGDPRWRLVAKEMVFAMMAPSHPAVRVLPGARRTPLTIKSCRYKLNVLQIWFD
jgi:hypothetical protein